MTDFKRDGSHLASCPPVEKWDDWVELDPDAWPRRVEKHFQIVPTICFNCESACGLLAYTNKETGKIEKFEGNPKHPASAPKAPRPSIRFTIPIASSIP
jgi:anaerobic selenocysteine-containing dehydrogenase